MSQFRILSRSALCLMLVGLWGCGEAAKVHPPDADVARSSLEEALKSWVNGEEQEDLQPDVYMSDPAWKAGKKLVSFEIVDEEEAEGSNVNIRVKRKFDKADPSFDETVKYIITTNPVITIVPQ